MYDFKGVKDLYQDGYRCIYYDNETENPLVYLKNFDNEDSKEVEFKDEQEFEQFKNYIGGLRATYF